MISLFEIWNRRFILFGAFILIERNIKTDKNQGIQGLTIKSSNVYIKTFINNLLTRYKLLEPFKNA